MKLIWITLTLLISTSMSFAQDFSSWCNDNLSVLKNAKRKAYMAYAKGDVASSINILKAGLNSAVTNGELYETSLTYKALTRGIAITNTVEQNINNKANATRTLNHFLNEYYDYVTSVVNELDRPYYNPQRCARNYCGGNIEVIERKYIKFAFSQVKMVLKNFAFDNGMTVYPKGSTPSFLTSLQMTTAYAANDLNQSIYADFYSCKINKLSNLSADLEDYNQSSGGDDVYMVGYGYHKAKKLAYKVRRCGGYRDYGQNDYDHNDDITGGYNQHPITEQILNRSFKFVGETKSVRIPNGTRYVRKLIISAEGVRRDAKFDVVVNGDVKGTIYVPGRDPSYTVTVNEFASSIEFVPHFGKSKVTKIFVVSE